jgi:hypothetical protein
MKDKRKRPRKAARLKRIPPSRQQKRGTSKHRAEHNPNRELPPAERGWITVPPSRRAEEATKRAERERLQRAEERTRRRAAVDRFIEEHRSWHEWINFADIADIGSLAATALLCRMKPLARAPINYC